MNGEQVAEIRSPRTNASGEEAIGGREGDRQGQADATNNIGSPPDNRPPGDPPSILMPLIKGSFDNNQHHVRKFITQLLSGDDKDSAIARLGEGKGLELVREILHFPISINAGTRKDTLSVQRCVLPFFALLSEARSLYARQQKAVYGGLLIYPDFVDAVIGCLDDMRVRGNLEDERLHFVQDFDLPTIWQPEHWVDAVLPLAKSLLALIMAVTDAQVNVKVLHWVEELEEMSEKWFETEPTVDTTRKSALDHAIKDAKRRFIAPSAPRTTAPEDPIDAVQRRLKAVKVDTSRDPGLPGHLDPLGQRHDNDHADFRTISILPTKGEIFASRDPYLPGLQGRHHLPPGPDRYLDVHFRLLRHKNFVEEGGHTLLSDRKSGVVWRGGDDQVVVFRDVSIDCLAPNIRHGVVLQIGLSNPDTKTDYWGPSGRGSEYLSNGSLAILWLHAGRDVRRNTPMQDRQIYFTTVAARDPKQVGRNDKVTIGLTLLETEDLAAVLHAASIGPNGNAGNGDIPSEHVLLQIRGHFFTAGEAVLKSLQSHNADSLPFGRKLFGDAESTEDEFANPMSMDHIDLRSCSLEQDMGLSQVPMDREAIIEALDGAAGVELNSTQIRAVAAALSQDISLIQGPPGCGKTYVGVRIMEILLANLPVHRPASLARAMRSATVDDSLTLPILCVTFTNHALDQFSEDLIDRGLVPAPGDIVRVGAGSKSEKLKGRNLWDLSFRSKTKDEFYRMKQLQKVAEEQDERVKTAYETTQRKLHEWRLEHFAEYLQYENPDILEELLVKSKLAVDAHGFQIYLGKNSRADPLQQWLAGMDLKFGMSSNEDTESDLSVDVNRNTFAALDTDATDADMVVVDEEETNSDSGSFMSARAHSDEYLSEADLEGLANIALQDRELGILRDLIEADASLIWQTSVNERVRVMHDWVRDCQDIASHRLDAVLREYAATVSELQDIETASQLRVLRNAKVVLMTTSGAAKLQRLLRGLAAQVVICEEAGEVLEAHIVTSLTARARKLILIGDHLQLRPKVAEFSLSIDSNTPHQLDLSLFERLVNRQAVRESSHGMLGTLHEQRRMRPEVSALMLLRYPSLVDSPVVSFYPSIIGVRENLWFFDHDWPEAGESDEEQQAHQSKRNLQWARMVVEFVAHLIKQGYVRKANGEDRICVLTPYVGQLLVIKRLFKEKRMAVYLDDRTQADAALIEPEESSVDGDHSDADEPDAVHLRNVSAAEQICCSSLENYQGRESDIIVISSVRCNKQNRIGFMGNDNRMTVMLSRARHGMYIFGSAGTFKSSSKGTLFRTAIERMEQENLIGDYVPLICSNHPETQCEIRNVQDFARFSPDGGCQQPCGFRLSKCAHACRKACHPDDQEHRFVICQAPLRLLPCAHDCPDFCGQSCSPCGKLVNQILPCGHRRSIQCWRQDVTPCSATVKVTSPLCEHSIEVFCGMRIQLRDTLRGTKAVAIELGRSSPLFICNERCGGTRECGHVCAARCGDCSYVTATITGDQTVDEGDEDIAAIDRTRHDGECTQMCDRPLLCGHSCGGTCHRTAECPPCGRTCDNKCGHSVCAKLCASSCVACAEPCSWICAHDAGPCPLPCGAPCFRLPCDERCTKALMCGHGCPSVCGEPCPKPGVGCQICAEDKYKDSAVDFLMLTTLRDVDLTDEPLITFGCGHSVVLSSADGIMRMKTVYDQASTGSWSALRSLPVEVQAVPQCPNCRAPIHGIARYGRLLHHVALEQAKRKYLISYQELARELNEQLGLAQLRLDEGEVMAYSLGRIAHKASQEKIKELKKECRIADKAQKKAFVMCEGLLKQAAMENPIAVTYEKSLVAITRLGNTGNPRFATVEELARSQTPHLAHCPEIEIAVSISHIVAEPVVITAQMIKAVRTIKLGLGDKKLNMSTLKTIGDTINRLAARRTDTMKVCEVNKCARLGRDARGRGLDAMYRVLQSLNEFYGSGIAPSAILPELSSWRSRLLENIEEDYASRLTESKSEGEVGYESPDDLRAIEARMEKAIEICSNTGNYSMLTLEEKKAIFGAMGQDVGTGRGSFGGHWYTCPNGDR